MTTNFENEDGSENNENKDNPEFSDVEMEPIEEAPKGSIGNFADSLRDKPIVKFTALVVGVFAIGTAAIKFFGSNGQQTKEVAHLTRPPALREAPGGVASPYLRQQTELANNQRVEQALNTGGSAIPTPIGQSTDVSNNAIMAKEADPMKELRAETDQLRRQIRETQRTTRPPEGFDNSLAEAMQKQLSQLMQSWQATGIKAVEVSKNEAKGRGADGGSGGSFDSMDKIIGGDIPTGAMGVSGGGGGSASVEQKPLVAAGTVSYAQLLMEANSDVPGPILAHIVSGPLTGARAIGAFQVVDGYEKYVVMKFSLADKNGKDYPINAIALDPETTLGGMATEVDERYFSRVVLPAAASFIQGVGQALGQTDTSIVMNGSTTISTQTAAGMEQGLYNGLGQAANTVGQFFQQQANLTKPLVRVAAGTPFGLFFLAPVRSSGAAQQVGGMDMSGGGAGGGVGGGYSVNYAPAGNTYSGGDASIYGNQQNGSYTGTASGYNGNRLITGRSNTSAVSRQN